MATLDTESTFNPLRKMWDEEIIGVIETRRDSAGSYDGGVVAYREAGVEGDYAYVVHYYSIDTDRGNRVTLSNGTYRLTRRRAMERLVALASLQGHRMYDPTLG